MTASARRRDPGFFKSSRAALRELRAGVSGDVAMVVHELAIEAGTDGVLRVGHRRELADELGVSWKWLRSRLEAAEAAGLIEWERAANQYADGAIRVLVDLAYSGSARPDSGQPRPVDNGVPGPVPGPVVGPMVGPVGGPNGSGHPGETTPKSEEWRVKSGDDVSASPSGTHARGANVGAEGDGDLDQETSDIVDLAVRRITTIRESAGYGPAGPGALRKVADELRSAGLDEHARRWLADGHPPHRIAAALADRFTEANRHAVPWSPGAEVSARRHAPEAAGACPACDGSGLMPDRTPCRWCHTSGTPHDLADSVENLEAHFARERGTGS